MAEHDKLWSNSEGVDQQPAAEAGVRMSASGIGEQSGNATERFDIDVDIESEDLELSVMSISSTRSSELEVYDLSSPSELDESQAEAADETDGDVDVDEDIDVETLGNRQHAAQPSGCILEPYTAPMPDEVINQAIEAIREGMAEPAAQPMPDPRAAPMIDLSSLCSDWPTVHRFLMLSELRVDQLARIWQLLQRSLLLLANSTLQLPLPSADGQQPADFDAEWHSNWSVYQQQLEEFVQVAELFAQLIQYEIFGNNFL
ncbi:uncharacterized protein LOC111601625 [Drosophila hydei]|uniref:Uncharacterized protein LOC111601625 n=1 Tax=Drosophila hydei TaxID=7224 RepID=A0A6J1M4P3_DROHY|nr:uncharacterized protein LOC111601625 [Drosophila hydei]